MSRPMTEHERKSALAMSGIREYSDQEHIHRALAYYEARKG